MNFFINEKITKVSLNLIYGKLQPSPTPFTHNLRCRLPPPPIKKNSESMIFFFRSSKLHNLSSILILKSFQRIRLPVLFRTEKYHKIERCRQITNGSHNFNMHLVLGKRIAVSSLHARETRRINFGSGFLKDIYASEMLSSHLSLY